MFFNLFSPKKKTLLHPLADPEALERAIGLLPLDDAFKSVDKAIKWINSLDQFDDFDAESRFAIVRRIDDAIQPHLFKLSRHYLTSRRLSKSEEKRLWTISYDCWDMLARAYESCLQLVQKEMEASQGRMEENVAHHLPLLLTRLVRSLGAILCWTLYRYMPLPNEIWPRLGRAYLFAETNHCSNRKLQCYPGFPGLSTVRDEYLRVLVFHASSVDGLMPFQMALADYALRYLLPHFVFAAETAQVCAYWIDVDKPMPPTRLVNPETPSPTLRLIGAGEVPSALGDLAEALEAGNVPPGFPHGGEFTAQMLLPVVEHLSLYWSAQPPLREHLRHPIRARASVLNGFDDSFTVFAGNLARMGKERAAESWVVENASLGGFGAMIENFHGDWLKVGALLSIHPEGSEGWMLGVIRRLTKLSEEQTTVGIQMLGRLAKSIELMPSVRSYESGSNIPGIRLDSAEAAGEIRVVLPAGTFRTGEKFEYMQDGYRFLLSPLDFSEREGGGDFEIGRYRQESLDKME
ncbi:MAG: hypothetical protein FWD77_01795 [Betaproteobacteria bacterium]|nr:hypothetical protein [Betaproteobacteria bacterium]